MENEISIRNNESVSRFETKLDDGEYAFLEYRWYEGNLALMHTLVPEGYEGKGIAGALAKFAFDFVKDKNVKAIVYCPYVAVYLKRHPEYESLVVPIKR